MNVLPVIIRELRQQARARFTYNLRVLGAGSLVFVCACIAILFSGAPSELGAWLFGGLNTALFLTIWIFTPLACADCLSREKREGTLGLLLLTPLKAWEIVAAKCVAQGIRAFSLLLVAVPVITIPVLTGGVGWPDIAASVLNNSTALFLALAVSLVASAATRRSLPALLLAFGLTVAIAAALVWVIGANGETEGATSNDVTFQDLVDRPIWGPRGLIVGGIRQLLVPFFTFSGGSQIVSSKLPTAGQMATLRGGCVIAGASWLTLMVAVTISASIIRRTWRDKNPGPVQRWMARTFCAPSLWTGLFRRWSRRSLERNPVGWLGRRKWSGRIGIWGWLMVVILLFSFPIWIQESISFANFRWIMSWLLLGCLAAGTARGFRDERESG